jgi:type III secretion protein S
MNTNEVVSYVIQSLTLTLILSMPAIVVASVVGTLFSLLQALTQIQEQTLSFAIKLIAVGLTLFLTASWMGGELVNYTVSIFDNFYKTAR